MIGVGGNNTKEVDDSIEQVKSLCDYIMLTVPYYNKPNQRGLFQHFKAIANSTSIPVIIYNVPGRTCSNISSETCLELANESAEY